MTATLDAPFAAAAEHIEIKRDRWGRYLLPDPTSGREQPWQRVTTFIKLLANTYNIEKWRLRQAAIGLAARPDLLALVGSTLDPDSRDGRRAIGDAVDKAVEAAGASTGANMGTALHQLTEAQDLGHDLTAPTREIATKLEDYAATLARHNLTVVPEWIERIIVSPELAVAGTADRFVRCADGKVRVADLKTGKSVDFGHVEFAMQLAAYANAAGMYNGSGWDPMPDDLDLTTGYIIHLPAAHDGPCAVHSVDIEEGWKACLLAAEVRAVQRRKGLLMPLGATTTAEPVADDERRLEVLRRCRLLDPERKVEMKTRWPAGVPGLTNGHRHTEAQLDAVEAVLDIIDGSRVDAKITGELIDKMKALPGDLFLAVEATAKTEGVPHVDRGWSTTHAERLAELITAAEIEAAERHMYRVKALAEFHEADLMAICEMAEVPRDDVGLSSLDDLTHERVIGFAETLEVFGTLAPEPDVVIDHHGGKRAFATTAKAAARRHGLAVPKSAAQAAESPALVALAFTTTPTETETPS